MRHASVAPLNPKSCLRKKLPDVSIFQQLIHRQFEVNEVLRGLSTRTRMIRQHTQLRMAARVFTNARSRRPSRSPTTGYARYVLVNNPLAYQKLRLCTCG